MFSLVSSLFGIKKMKLSKLITLSVCFLLVSCLEFDKNTFSLVCVGTETNESRLWGKKGQSKTITLNFKNKQLERFDCHTWTDEKILCAFNSDKSSNSYEHSTINIDRVSGAISTGSHKANLNERNELGSASITIFEGKCEKVKEKKI